MRFDCINYVRDHEVDAGNVHFLSVH
jgi:hypothetical protein